MHEVNSQPALSDLNQRSEEASRPIETLGNTNVARKTLKPSLKPPQLLSLPAENRLFHRFLDRKSYHKRGRFRRKRVTYALASSDRRQTRGGLVPVSDTRVCVCGGATVWREALTGIRDTNRALSNTY